MRDGPSKRDIAMQTLSVDATTAEVVQAFQRAGCRSILLKGPTLQRELYRDGSRRPYYDTDVLVHPADLPRAGAALADLGFELLIDHSDHPGVSEPHAQDWGRPPRRKNVDLHWRVPGVDVPAERAWDVLAARSEPITVGGAASESLDAPGLALLVALHAAHHGTTIEAPLRDLGRAVAQFTSDTWAAAARLAAELDALQAFAAGLRLTPAGTSLAADLGLPPVRSPRRRLLASNQPPGSLGLLRIVEAPGARARTIRDELFPAPTYMRAMSGLARRGAAGLVLAYLTRILSRTWRLPAAIQAVRRSRESPPPARRAP